MDLVDEAEFLLKTLIEMQPVYVPALLTYSTVLARNVSTWYFSKLKFKGFY